MAAADKFSRFGDKRKINSDTKGYDDYVEGVEADEVTSLETPLPEDNRGFRLIKMMGWSSGTGLGKFEQGRKDPVPFELKDDHMGLGRWTMELEQAQETTERRRQLEAEKELTDDLLEQYQLQAEKDRKLLETLTEMNKSFYCELCDRQYTKYSEYDNHINSYSHHHQQRLRSLKEYETGRRFGGHRNNEEEKEKMLAAQMVAIERAQMRMKQQQKQMRGHAPGFKPVGDTSSSQSQGEATNIIGIKRSALPSSTSGDSGKTDGPEKKSKLAKYGMKFQSAGTLMSIGDQIGKDTPLKQETVKDQVMKEANPQVKGLAPQAKDSGKVPPKTDSRGGSLSSKLLARYTTAKWDKAGDFEKRLKEAKEKEHEIRVEKAPPPLKSRQKELNMDNYSGGEDDEEDFSVTARTIIKKPAKFKFNLAKKL